MNQAYRSFVPPSNSGIDVTGFPIISHHYDKFYTRLSQADNEQLQFVIISLYG